MAASNSQKQLLTLIRDFAAEKSQGERRVFNLKKRIDELRSELEVANSDLQTYKSTKETAEQELKGYEVQLSISEASIQTLEARIGSIQDEVSKVGSDVDALKVISWVVLFNYSRNFSHLSCLMMNALVWKTVAKNEEAALRDGFICQMLKLKTKIRKFQEFALLNLQQRICLSTSSEHNHARGEDAEFVDLEKRMSVIVAQTAAEEQECEREQNLHNQLHQELDDSKRRKELIEGIMKDIKDLQDLTRQTSELEEKCASFSEELQRRCICPSCHVDNSNSLAELLQQMEQQ